MKHPKPGFSSYDITFQRVVSKKKIERFAETATFPNFFQPDFREAMEGFRLRGRWSSEYFGNHHPLVLELGCGKGEYTTGLARKYPHKNFIGVDIKGARMWRGAKTALEENLSNAAFLRSQVGMVGRFFGPDEVSEIWIPFPDPQQQNARSSKRLTSPRFIGFYRKILAPDAIIHLKTDNAGLFAYTLDVIAEQGHRLLFATHDLYAEDASCEAAEIQTYYENIWLKEGSTIKYLNFRLNPEMPRNDEKL
jgi:tRNA (guanine-N7-)-methyltransferase